MQRSRRVCRRNKRLAQRSSRSVCKSFDAIALDAKAMASTSAGRIRKLPTTIMSCRWKMFSTGLDTWYLSRYFTSDLALNFICRRSTQMPTVPVQFAQTSRLSTSSTTMSVGRLLRRNRLPTSIFPPSTSTSTTRQMQLRCVLSHTSFPTTTLY